MNSDTLASRVSPPSSHHLRPAVLALALASTPLGCERSKAPAEALGFAASSATSAASAEPVARIAGGVPLPAAVVEKVVNPKRQPAYSGPTGTVAGSVVISGDLSPEKEEWIASIPKDCLAAREMYKDLFREGLMRSVADVFVAVTGYQGYVPAATDQKLVEASGCAFSTKTVGLTYGQGLDIVSKDVRAYVPELLGAKTTAQLVVTPGGKPIRLYPQRPGRYVLMDSMRTFATAEVLVVAYPTFDVTGLDGKFEIKNVPVGQAKLNALLPAAMLTTERDITVESGKTTSVELELHFDRKAWEKAEAEKSAKEARSKKERAAKEALAKGANAGD